MTPESQPTAERPTPDAADRPAPPTRYARRDPRPSVTQCRVRSALLLVPCAALLLTALYLSPDNRGYGTHERLGLPACGFKSSTGWPCMTCGMTTSFSLAAHGDLIASFQNQPMGACFALFTACLLIIATYGLITGAYMRPLWDRVLHGRNVIIAGILMLIAWVYKIGALQGVS